MIKESRQPRLPKQRTIEPKPIDWAGLPAVLHVLKRVTDPGVPLSTQARLLALVLADIVDSKTGVGFAHQKTLAARLGVSVRTVQRCWDKLDGILFRRSFPGETRGHKHKSARYTVIRSDEEPEVFNRRFNRSRFENQREPRPALCEPGVHSRGSFKGIVTGDTNVASGDDIGVASKVTRMAPQVGEKSREAGQEELRLQARRIQGQIDDREYARLLAEIRRQDQ